MPEEKDKDRIQQAQEEAEARAAARMAANKEEADALAAAQQAELAGLQEHNTAQYENVGQIVGDIQSKINTATAKDALARKREDAYRNITGLGDTLSSLANLVGTAHGAANQQQTYNSHAVVQKAEEARKARKIEMDDLSKRLDEMTARQKDLKAAGSLAEAQMAVQHKKEQMTLKNQQEKEAREAEYKERALMIDQMNAQANIKRAEASETNAETKANNPTTRKPDKEHSFELEGGERITIPAHKWTDTAITSVYSSIPDNLRTKRQRMRKNIAGIDEPEVDASGNPVYHTPTRQEMLNDIVNAAKTDKTVADALRKYAGAATGANDPEFE